MHIPADFCTLMQTGSETLVVGGGEGLPVTTECFGFKSSPLDFFQQCLGKPSTLFIVTVDRKAAPCWPVATVTPEKPSGAAWTNVFYLREHVPRALFI